MSTKRSTSIFLVSLATIISRITGLVRDQFFAFLLGATNFADAFIVAFRIPNMLRDLFAEGSLSTAFIPTFTHYLYNKSKKQAIRLANDVIHLLFLIPGILVIVGSIYTPQIVKFIAPGFGQNASKFYLTIIMTKILMPFILFVSLAALFMGMLNVHKKFFIPAFAPALFNVVIIITGIFIILINPNDVNKAILWSLGALLGGLVQLFILLPFAKKIGYSYQFHIDWKFQSQGVRQILKLMLPSIIGLAAVQVNIIVNTNLASFLQTGSVSYLNYAFRLIQFPIGIFGIAISTVNTALVSKDIAQKNHSNLKDNVAFALKFNSFLNIPSTIFLILLGLPVIKLIFQHGKFTTMDSFYTYYSLAYYAPCILFYSGVKILAPIFYAMKKAYIPVISSTFAVITNLIISLLSYKIYGIKGLSFALTFSALINFLFLLIVFVKYFGWFEHQIFISMIKHIVAAVVMGIAGYFTYQLLIHTFWLVAILSSIMICGLIYALVSYIFKTEELMDFINIFRRKIQIRGQGSGARDQ